MISIDAVSNCIEHLIRLYTTTFGGKLEGRYKISRFNLAKLCGKEFINDKDIEFLTEVAAAKGLVIIYLGHEFAILDNKIPRGYRDVPKWLMDEMVEDYNRLLGYKDKNE